MPKLIDIINFASLGDNRGSLVVLEENKNIPFDIKRLYYMFGCDPKISRGHHAHKRLRQIAICITGSCRMILNDGKIKEEVIMDSPAKGVLLDKLIWHEMHDFSQDCVLLVVADNFYDESDYIRDYSDFLNTVNQ